MDIENVTIVERTDKTMTVAFRGETETLLNLLKQKLLANDAVEHATYVMGHPLKDIPVISFTCTSGKPETHLKNAAKELRATFDELETQLLKA